MATTYIGTFTLPTAGVIGPQTVTGIPFTPKAVVIWGQFSGKFTNPSPNQAEFDSFGIDDGVTHVGQCIFSVWFVGLPWRGVAGTNGYSILASHSIFSAGYDVLG